MQNLGNSGWESNWKSQTVFAKGFGMQYQQQLSQSNHHTHNPNLNHKKFIVLYCREVVEHHHPDHSRFRIVISHIILRPGIR